MLSLPVNRCGNRLRTARVRLGGLPGLGAIRVTPAQFTGAAVSAARRSLRNRVNARRIDPTEMATSATLKIPVRNGPKPRLRKSVTRPLFPTRSIMLPIPPVRIRPKAMQLRRCTLAGTKQRQATPVSRTAFTMIKLQKRASADSVPPNPRNAPGFSA